MPNLGVRSGLREETQAETYHLVSVGHLLDVGGISQAGKVYRDG